MRATPDEYPGSVEEVLGRPVLESGSLGLAALAEGDVSEETGLPFSIFTSGERSGLEPIGEGSVPWITEGSCCRDTKVTAASLE